MSDDDAYGPALPPGLVRNPAGPTRPTEPFADQLSPNPSRVGPSIGPARPGPSRPAIGPSRPVAIGPRPSAGGPGSPSAGSSGGPSSGPSRPLGPSLPGPAPPGPSLPPGPVRPGPSRPPGPELPGPSRPPGPELPGPSRPPGPLPHGPSPPRPPSDSDSDDEIGPHLPAAPSSHSAADTFREREARIARARAAADVPKKPQRDEWMTLGPPSGLSHIDALKRPTQFQKNSREAAPVDQGWLETPAERAARERDEADGAHPPPLKRKAQGTEGQRERDEEMRRRIEAHSKSRGASLLQKHRENRKEASPPPIWDRETMMGVGSALSGEERVKKIREAADLGDRFGHGRSGAYM